MKCIIIAGGKIEDDFLEAFLKEQEQEKQFIIACDKGYETCERLSLTPNLVIGDFDSASPGVVDRITARGIEIKILNPVKDDTDTEAALRYAFDITDELDSIFIFGGTGSRIDHMLGNIALLGLGLKNNRNVILLDSHNFIQMIRPGDIYIVDKEEGLFVSVIPYMGVARKVTMEGFKYPLTEADIKGFDTLTISNQVVAQEGHIFLEDGYLIVIESRD